ncbi:MAG: cupin domain-containing protein [Treponema sp.]|nr:cupin domain-containing protein [Treponema sp.]
MTKEEFNKIDRFGVGEPNTAFAQYFIGNSYLKPLTDIKGGEIPIFNVSFEPGCRNNWHIHHSTKGGGQVLICTAGSGWYQDRERHCVAVQKQSGGLFLASLRAAMLRRWGKDAVPLEPGMVIVIPANVKHWHGAKKDSWFSHITFEPSGENTSNEWLEAVTDEAYEALGE